MGPVDAAKFSFQDDHGIETKIACARFRVQGLEFSVQDSGFRAYAGVSQNYSLEPRVGGPHNRFNL